MTSLKELLKNQSKATDEAVAELLLSQAIIKAKQKEQESLFSDIKTRQEEQDEVLAMLLLNSRKGE